jgi:hypothetical protein
MRKKINQLPYLENRFQQVTNMNKNTCQSNVLDSLFGCLLNDPLVQKFKKAQRTQETFSRNTIQNFIDGLLLLIIFNI